MQYYCDAHENWILSGFVEIDESKLYKEKVSYALARPCEYGDIWIIGFKERSSKKFLILPVESRDQDAFLPLLLKHSKTDSTIYTDCFSVYINNRTLPLEFKLHKWGYKHYFIDHSYSFVNAIFSNTHTNTVERLWRSLKDHVKYYQPRRLYEDCIGRFFS